MDNLKNSKTKYLYQALLNLQTEKEAANFCRDLMTISEIEEFAARLEVAKKLKSGIPQRKVSADTGVSIATVTRVNQWLKRGKGGYTLILDRISNKNSKKELTSLNHHKHHKLTSES